MNKKIIIIYILLLSCVCIMPGVVEAHILGVDGSIGALLHIDPEDDPIVKQQSNFFLEFKDKNNKFQSTNCYCRVDIIQHGKVIYSNALFQSLDKNTNTAFESFTFPIRDVYQIQVIGKPRTANTFQPFKLTYDIRVEREFSSNNPSQKGNWFSVHFIHLLGGIIIIIFCIIALIQKAIQKQKYSNMKGGKKKNDKKVLRNTY